ncbi:MAG TPA: ferrochelatase [Rhodothermales bacterium]|nr:ferrochelatase [Rhodothermales bacterium]
MQPPHDDRPIGVLFMAYGGPNSLDEIPGYLADIRNGRPTTPAVLDEITYNYAAIGGRSPLLDLTRQQADAIMAHLNPPGTPARFRAYLGMRHWVPWIEETVGQMIADGIERAVAIVLAPHFSTMSIQKYQAKVRDGLDLYRGHIDVAFVDAYFDVPGLIEPLAERVRQGLAEWPEAERDRVHVVFSAHSLPVRILQMGDPYDAQLRTTARLVAEAAGLTENQWSWSYQSAGRSPKPWLGPQLQDHLADLAAQGIRDVVSVPVGFVSDHVEILYDIDVQGQEVAAAHGMRLVRPPSLNADPRFVRQLADLVRDRAETAGWLEAAAATT